MGARISVTSVTSVRGLGAIGPPEWSRLMVLMARAMHHFKAEKRKGITSATPCLLAAIDVQLGGLAYPRFARDVQGITKRCLARTPAANRVGEARLLKPPLSKRKTLLIAGNVSKIEAWRPWIDLGER
jgi:hypothetical protein